MMVVNKLTKSSHFILVKSTYKAIHIVDIFMREIFRLHCMPKAIILDQDVKFTSKIWNELFEGLATKFGFSTTYHT